LDHIEVIRLLLRITARTSFVLFFAAFIARASQLLWPGKYTDWLAQNCGRFLIALGISHTVHLFVIVSLVVSLGEKFRLPAGLHGLLAGIFVYFMIYILALRSFLRAPEGRFWQIVDSPLFERCAMYSIWTIFAISFLSRVRLGPPVYSFLGIAIIAGPIIRITAGIRTQLLRGKEQKSVGWIQ
jgi:methionine sulfoxide reductase heme-binding subunit